MNPIFSIKIDENEVLKLIGDTVNRLVEETEGEYVFWDTSELKKRTCMSWNTLQETFFYDPRFIKRKVGGKWYFPARETRIFLVEWLLEHDI